MWKNYFKAKQFFENEVWSKKHKNVKWLIKEGRTYWCSMLWENTENYSVIFGFYLLFQPAEFCLFVDIFHVRCNIAQ